MASNNKHIAPLISVCLLFILLLAIAPWNALHNHKRATIAAHEKDCHHLTHLETRADDCPICTTGFEKNYVNTHKLFNTYLGDQIFNYSEPTLESCFTEIKQASLRGPPSA